MSAAHLKLNWAWRFHLQGLTCQDSWKLKSASGKKDNSPNNAFVQNYLLRVLINSFPVGCQVWSLVLCQYPGGGHWGRDIRSPLNSGAPAKQQLLRKRNFTASVWSLLNCIAHIFHQHRSSKMSWLYSSVSAASDLYHLGMCFVTPPCFPDSPENVYLLIDLEGT